MKDRPAYRSYSQLTEYMKCGESFRLSRRVGIKEQPSVWLPGGSAFHTLTEHIDTDLTITDADIRDVWVESFTWQVADSIERAPDEYKDPDTWRVAGKGKETLEWWTGKGTEWGIQYRDWRKTSGLEVMVDGDRELIEAELMPILYSGDAIPHGVPVKMYPDRIMVDGYGQLMVLDIKTGSSAQPSTLQLGTYKVGVEKLLGYTVEWGAFYSARKGTIENPQRLDQWTEERIAYLFATFDQQERAGVYLPNIGSHCKYMCSVKAHCVYQGGTPHPDDLPVIQIAPAIRENA